MWGWIHLARHTIQWFGVLNTGDEPWGPVKGETFLDQLNKY
jgi:hypothetical protein